MSWSIWGRSAVAAAIALPLLLAGANAKAAEPPLAADLAQRLARDGRGDFVVEFRVAPDLTPALALSGERRARFVIDTLKAANERVHGGALRYLAGRQLASRSFLVGNLLYVFAGDVEAARALAALPEVARVRAPITIMLPPLVESALPAPLGAATWGLADSGAPAFWATFDAKGEGIVVANIDTGVQYDHPALAAQFNCASPTDRRCWLDPADVCGGAGPCDNNGHGTHTMGTMVAADTAGLPYIAGMAPGAKWIACKGCESNSCSELALNTCADWLLAPGGDPAARPHVVNNSWGGGGNNPWYRAKVQAWQAAGIFPAFSAGNGGSRCGSLGSPGDYQESFTTAAHDASREVAAFSARGPSRAFGHDPYTKPNLSAPGVGIVSTVPTNGWASYSGTSMASPHAAGAVALLWSCTPTLKGQIGATMELLQNTAAPAPAGSCGAPPDGEGNYTFGYGYLDVLAAGERACGAPPPLPTLSVDALAVRSACLVRAVIARALIDDGASQPVAEALVTGTWTFPDATTVAVSKATVASGEAQVATRTRGNGLYRFCVSGVVKAGYTYSPAGNVKTCEEVLVSCR